MAMTPLQSRICDDIVEHGPSTAQQIADRLGLTRASVNNSLTFGRGYGFFDDGSTELSTKVFAKDGSLVGIATSEPEYPLIWKIQQ